jgi:hypothetical protein
MKRFAPALLLCAAANAAEISNEFDAEYSISGGQRTRLGGERHGSVSGQTAYLRDVVSTRLGEGPLLRLGVEWQRFDFGVPDGAPLPDTLQSLNAVVGLDLQLLESWLVRIEATPGFYGTGSLRGNDFAIPFVIGGSYIASADLQWILGVSVDLNRAIPVFPGVGVRWKFSDHWVLNAVMPRPRLEYEWSKSLTLYGGADLRGSTFRVDRNFGTAHGDARLNRAWVDLTEIRAGVGATWKVSSWLSAEIETGCAAYRDFDFHRADTNYESKGAAAYGQIVIGAKF